MSGLSHDLTGQDRNPWSDAERKPLTWDDFLVRCREANIGWRDDHDHIRMIGHLSNLGWLALFEFVDGPPEVFSESTSGDLWATFLVQPRTAIDPEVRILIEILPDAYRVVARSRLQKEGEDGFKQPSRYNQGNFSSFVQTDDPYVMEYWLRRQPVQWP